MHFLSASLERFDRFVGFFERLFCFLDLALKRENARNPPNVGGFYGAPSYSEQVMRVVNGAPNPRYGGSQHGGTGLKLPTSS